jgi:hypothetical protein
MPVVLRQVASFIEDHGYEAFTFGNSIVRMWSNGGRPARPGQPRVPVLRSQAPPVLRSQARPVLRSQARPALRGRARPALRGSRARARLGL